MARLKMKFCFCFCFFARFQLGNCAIVKNVALCEATVEVTFDVKKNEESLLKTVSVG